jgi:glycosyltransferase involved in cell wall biosynthesis
MKKILMSMLIVFNMAQALDKKFVIIVPSYKNAAWYIKNLDSIFCQTYQNYHVIYTDDASPDGTGALVAAYIEERQLHDKITLIINEKNCGALENIYNMVHSCEDNVVIVSLDGDDWFAHEHVLEVLNAAYQDENVWLTYGNYTHPWGGSSCCDHIQDDLVMRNAYREKPLVASHLRTFYAWLFKKIRKEDLLYDGVFFPMTWDWAMMFPMLEMSGGRFKFIEQVLYIYNTDNPINDFKKDEKFQIYLSTVIQAKKRYEPLTYILSPKERGHLYEKKQKTTFSWRDIFGFLWNR